MTKLLVVAACIAVAGGCKSKTESKPTQGETKPSETKPPETKPPAETPPAEGSAIVAEQMGTFMCTDLQRDVCLDPKDQFPATAPVVHMTYKTKDLPANGGTYVIKWIAEDVGAAAPANAVIATLNESVKDVQAGLKNYVVNSKVSKPTAGWPVGKYRVEVSYNDKLVTTARFSIQ